MGLGSHRLVQTLPRGHPCWKDADGRGPKPGFVESADAAAAGVGGISSCQRVGFQNVNYSRATVVIELFSGRFPIRAALLQLLSGSDQDGQFVPLGDTPSPSEALPVSLHGRSRGQKASNFFAPSSFLPRAAPETVKEAAELNMRVEGRVEGHGTPKIQQEGEHWACWR